MACSPGNFCYCGTNNSGCCEYLSDILQLDNVTIVALIGASTSTSGDVSTAIASTAFTTMSTSSAPAISHVTVSPTIRTPRATPVRSTPNHWYRYRRGSWCASTCWCRHKAGLYYLLAFRQRTASTDPVVVDIKSPPRSTTSLAAKTSRTSWEPFKAPS